MGQSTQSPLHNLLMKHYSDAPLNCGLHNCAMRCHRVDDHSKMPCPHKVERFCDRGHKLKMPCHMRNDKCRTCAQDDLETERRIKRDLKLEAERQAREAAYKRDLQEIQDEIEHERRTLRYRKDEEEQQKILAQQRADLAALKQTTERVLRAPKAQAKQNMPGSFPGIDPPTPPTDEDSSDRVHDLPNSAAQEWKYLKQLEGAKSEPLDELMGMIGLEEVKSEFLSVKSKVDTAIRQDVSLDKERFGCSMLGNPGTGKFNARLFARLLISWKRALLEFPYPIQLDLCIFILFVLRSPLLILSRKNNRCSYLCSISYIARRHSRLLFQRRDGSQSSQCWSIWLQEYHR